jgi:hypothetical protein
MKAHTLSLPLTKLCKFHDTDDCIVLATERLLGSYWYCREVNAISHFV